MILKPKHGYGNSTEGDAQNAECDAGQCFVVISTFYRVVDQDGDVERNVSNDGQYRENGDDYEVNLATMGVAFTR